MQLSPRISVHIVDFVPVNYIIYVNTLMNHMLNLSPVLTKGHLA